MNAEAFHRMSRFTAFALIACLVLLSACVAPSPRPAAPAQAAPDVNLDGIKSYLLDQAGALKSSTAALKVQSDRYYDLAAAAGLDYGRLWQDQRASVIPVIEAARSAWIEASPQYEKMEGIVAGTPTLAQFDLILDAGASREEDPENAVPFDLKLPDGRVLAQPGNLFGVTESTLWGTYPAYRAPVEADWNQDGAVEFGETLPDAAVLKASVDALDSYAGQLLASAQSWTPSVPDAFRALIVMVPTMNEYFASWRASRFVAGGASTQRDFVAISRLADMEDILGGLQIVYAQVRPLVATVNPAQSQQIESGLSNLKLFVASVHQQEMSGKRFSAEDADLLGAEAQNRATAITGQLVQAAGQLGLAIEE